MGASVCVCVCGTGIQSRSINMIRYSISPCHYESVFSVHLDVEVLYITTTNLQAQSRVPVRWISWTIEMAEQRTGRFT